MACTARELDAQRDWASINAWSFHGPYMELEIMLQERIHRINMLLDNDSPLRHQLYNEGLMRLRAEHFDELNDLRSEFADCECEDHRQDD
jgi:hypothetical protein